jgi:hypothetical protein
MRGAARATAQGARREERSRQGARAAGAPVRSMVRGAGAQAAREGPASIERHAGGLLISTRCHACNISHALASSSERAAPLQHSHVGQRRRRSGRRAQQAAQD